MGNFGARYVPEGFTFNVSGPTFVPFDKITVYWYLGYFNTHVFQALLDICCQGLHYHNGIIAGLPVPEYKSEVDSLVKVLITEAKIDWDSFETSWDFKSHPFLTMNRKSLDFDGTTITKVSESFYLWRDYTDRAFEKLKYNEEELNRIFIDIYGLQDELTPKVEDKDISIRKADLGRDIRSLISYAVGCMFGRYSLDIDGLAYAGGDWDSSKYNTFIPDKDNIIPITDEEYFEDDILGLFCSWLKKVYGRDTLEKNLDFIASALGNKGNTSRETIRNYFLNDFFKDHCATYSVTGSGKRPIYWLFDSGKQNGFKALIYLHRYNADTIGNLRIDYLHRIQRIYESEIDRMQDMIDHSKSSREAGFAKKRKEKLQKQLKECRDYDERIGHLALSRTELDLDDGVKVNYRKIQTASD